MTKSISISGIDINNICSCVPKDQINNIDLPIEISYLERIISNTGIKSRRITKDDVTAADLCTKSAQHILDTSNLNKMDIGVIVFVTQYPDYHLPSTVHIIKNKLGLSEEVLAIQINEGCSGYIYGLQLVMSLMKTNPKDFGLLLVGDTPTKAISSDNTNAVPLFGDAGSATLLSKSQDSNWIFEIGSDGASYEDIMIKGGAFRFTNNRNLELFLNGMNVFAFSIQKIPTFIENFLLTNNITKNAIDTVVLHQANKMMTERILKKINLEHKNSPSSLEEYGNTSAASIPLSMTTSGSTISGKTLLCGFGVGLSWGAAFGSLKHVDLSLINY